MKTTIPAKITNVTEAQIFLHALFVNRESYHPEDPAQDIGWTDQKGNFVGLFSPEEAAQLNSLMIDIYSLENPAFDPCEYLLECGADTYILGDQPATCPLCGGRTEFTDSSDHAGHYQIHTCLNDDCNIRFKMVEDNDTTTITDYIPQLLFLS